MRITTLRRCCPVKTLAAQSDRQWHPALNGKDKIHSLNYTETVFNRLSKADDLGKEEVLRELGKIAKELGQGGQLMP